MVNERAQQFSAFSPLRGYNELLKSKEKKSVLKRELSDDSINEISSKLSQIKKGQHITITYYKCGEYILANGTVSKIDFIEQKLYIQKQLIKFSDIYKIELSKL